MLQARFLVIPIHHGPHWSVLVVCNLDTLLRRLRGDPGSRHAPEPFLLHLDSLQGERLGVACLAH